MKDLKAFQRLTRKTDLIELKKIRKNKKKSDNLYTNNRNMPAQSIEKQRDRAENQKVNKKTKIAQGRVNNK
jgi:hypothetical protein